jgi:hypothetical protein
MLLVVINCRMRKAELGTGAGRGSARGTFHGYIKGNSKENKEPTRIWTRQTIRVNTMHEPVEMVAVCTFRKKR